MCFRSVESPGSFRFIGLMGDCMGLTAKSKRPFKSRAGPDAMQTEPAGTEVTRLITALELHRSRMALYI